MVNDTPLGDLPPDPPFAGMTTGNHCRGSWLGPREVLDGCGKHRPPQGSDRRSVQPVALSLNRLTYPGPPFLSSLNKN